MKYEKLITKRKSTFVFCAAGFATEWWSDIIIIFSFLLLLFFLLHIIIIIFFPNTIKKYFSICYCSFPSLCSCISFFLLSFFCFYFFCACMCVFFFLLCDRTINDLENDITNDWIQWEYGPPSAWLASFWCVELSDKNRRVFFLYLSPAVLGNFHWIYCQISGPISGPISSTISTKFLVQFPVQFPVQF